MQQCHGCERPLRYPFTTHIINQDGIETILKNRLVPDSMGIVVYTHDCCSDKRGRKPNKPARPEPKEPKLSCRKLKTSVLRNKFIVRRHGKKVRMVLPKNCIN